MAAAPKVNTGPCRTPLLRGRHHLPSGPHCILEALAGLPSACSNRPEASPLSVGQSHTTRQQWALSPMAHSRRTRIPCPVQADHQREVRRLPREGTWGGGTALNRERGDHTTTIDAANIHGGLTPCRQRHLKHVSVGFLLFLFFIRSLQQPDKFGTMISGSQSLSTISEI